MEKEAEKEAELDGSDYARECVTMVDISKYFLDYHKKKREKEEEEEEMDAEKMMEEEDSNNMDTAETGTCTCTYIYMYIHLHLHAHVIQCNSNSLSLSSLLSFPLSSSIFFPFLSHHYLLLLLTRVTESLTPGSPVLYRRITIISSLSLHSQPSSSTLPTRMCLSLSLGTKGERK